MAQSKKSPAWEVNEKIAATLEKFLTPDAQVKHNVRLPVVGSPKKSKRQCDVVIVYGQTPRKSISIVEVQKRKRKPAINEFHGWIMKMRDVGAQQLICVSELGYPESIIEHVATKIGPTVTLMTLRELVDNVPRPLFMLPGLIYTSRHYEIKEVGFTETFELVEGVSIECSSAEKMFSLDDNPEQISLNQIIEGTLGQHSDLFNNKNGDFKTQLFDVNVLFTQKNKDSIKPNAPDPEIPYYIIVVNTDVQNLWIHYKNQQIRIKEGFIRIRVNTESRHKDMPFSQFEYHQESCDGALAWIATAKNPLNDQEIKIMFKQDKQGLLQLAFKG